VVEGLEEEVSLATGASVALNPETLEPLGVLTQEQEAMGYRWCPTCEVIKPPRTSHCRDCDNCVYTYDHHCPFVNNCVGQRNYAFFCGFLVSTGCLGFAVATGMGMYFSHFGADSGSTVSSPMLYLLLVVIGAPTTVLLLGVLGLGCFHTWLTCLGRTTKEVLTGKVTIGGRPLTTFRGPSLLHSRDQVMYPMSVV